MKLSVTKTRFITWMMTSSWLAVGYSGTGYADVPLQTELRFEPLASAHHDQLVQFGSRLPPALTESPHTLAPATDGPYSTVYGYWPYWGDDLSTVRFDSLSHLAIFGVTLTSEGTLTNTSYWTNNASRALGFAETYGVRVHLCVICFDSNVMSTVLSSSSKRSKAISEMVNLVESYGAHGVNIDFEGLPSSQKSNFVTFIQELNAQVDDLYLATPAVDWSGAYDYDVLAANSDGLFIMGYGYHYSGGDPGPIGPLYGGDPWSDYSLEWSVFDYIEWGTPREKIILGLPLYGYDWPSTNNNVPGDATGTGVAQTYSQAVPAAEAYGRHWDTTTHTPYAFPDSVSQLWYDDIESLSDKIGYGLGEDLQGIGFWAITYEDGDNEFWEMVDSMTGTGAGCDTIDADGDGANSCIDCNDNNPIVSPYQEEIPLDNLDNDCDGEVDEIDGGNCSAPSTLAGSSAASFLGLFGAIFGYVLSRGRRKLFLFLGV